MKTKCYFVLAGVLISLYVCGASVELQDKDSMKRAAKIKGEFYFNGGTDFNVWQKNARNRDWIQAPLQKRSLSYPLDPQWTAVPH